MDVSSTRVPSGQIFIDEIFTCWLTYSLTWISYHISQLSDIIERQELVDTDIVSGYLSTWYIFSLPYVEGLVDRFDVPCIVHEVFLNFQ